MSVVVGKTMISHDYQCYVHPPTLQSEGGTNMGI